MKWLPRGERPTVPGLYIHHSVDDDGWVHISGAYVWVHDNVWRFGAKKLRDAYPECGHRLIQDLWDSYRFAGPIPEPEED